MARFPRNLTVTSEGGFFHIYNRVAGPLRFFPFKRPRARGKFLRWLRYCLRCSCLRCASFTLMGNHFHLILSVEKFRRLAQAELEAFAQARWGRLWKVRTRYWSEKRWLRFNHDLFDLSVFMKDFKSPLTTWFNLFFKRRGSFWEGRYKSTYLADQEALEECLFYIELNPVRAGLVKRPETWKYGSASLRHRGQDQFLMPLEEIFHQVAKPRVFSQYRSLLLHRGTWTSKEGQSEIPAEIVAQEAARGFTPGLYLKRLRFFTDGVVLGSSDRVREALQSFREKGAYRRKRKPLSHLDGLLTTIRGQRSLSL